MMKGGEKKDEDEGYSPFEGLDKGAVLQETSLFNDPKVREHGATIRHCRHLMTKLLYMLGQGETFSEDQATELFFRVTKLFQCKDIYLRRLVYLLVKELADSADQVIIVTNCLQQDINRTENEMFRSNAIRVLCRIIPGSLLGQVERLVKQTITDNSPSVASAGLSSAMYLMKESPQIVKGWINEVNNQVMNKSNMVQFHALCLLLKMRENDKIAISKVVAGLTKGPSNTVRSPLAACVLIRKCCVLLEDEERPGETPHMDFLEVCLRHKNEMVVFEAARAICSLRKATAGDLVHAITVLQMFLSSTKPTLRFAAVRTLNRVAISQPLSVTTCNVDLESLISDSNRSIATLAITTLLKTGSEHSVDRLMKQISNFMSEIADEFKVVVVDAIRSMCIKYPAKHRTMMNFLSSILREEGGYEFKKAIVDSILTLINNIPDVQETGLSHLCEFIEDCEYTQLSTGILHLLGQRGPQSSEPGKYIRFIYNRVVLENAIVRASAVCALAKFGMACKELRPTIKELLRRCLYDGDDEVRDRASFYIEALNREEGEEEAHARTMVMGGLAFPVANLEETLKAYLKGSTSVAFDVSKVPKTRRAGAAEEEEASFLKTVADDAVDIMETPVVTKDYAKELATVPEFARLGALFCSSSAPAALTEKETEYFVECVKHVFEEHVVFQFNVTNTLEDQLLENVTVAMECADGIDLEEEFSLPAEAVPYGAPGTTFVCFQRDVEAIPAGTFECTLKFTIKDVDVDTGEPDEEGYPDEYQVDELEVSSSDFMRGYTPPSFKMVWDSLGDALELPAEQFQLDTFDSIEAGVAGVISFLGMAPTSDSRAVPDKVKSHTVMLGGVFVGNCTVLARANIARAEAGVLLTLQIRAENPDIGEVVLGSIG